MPLIPLPIDAILPQLVSSLKTASSVVLQAPPGAGKTTRVPPAVVDQVLADREQLWVLQPRRVAARSTARRMAEERLCHLGEEIGYQIRFERRHSPRTRIVVVTEGVLVRRLLSDPFLENIGGVILDEFHERHLETDLALAMLRRVQQTVRPDLKLLVMSATLAAEDVSRYLDGAPIINCPVPTFPVDIRYMPTMSQQPLHQLVATAVEDTIRQTSGDVLVFLPGVGEIQRAQDELSRRSLSHEFMILPLYGELSADQQDRVFQTTTQRKVILSTNVAETSITIPGVTTVIDSGLARVPEFDTATGLNRLVLKPISQAAADQRAGRAGRTGPGGCLRLWTQAAQRTRPAYETPEFQRVDLAGVVLSLRCWGEQDLSRFPWFAAPSSLALAQADQLLNRLGLLTSNGPTDLGQALQALPIHPRLGVLLWTGRQMGYLEATSMAAALLSERDPFLRSETPARARHHAWSDLADRVECLREFARTQQCQFELGTLQRDSARHLLRVAETLQRQCPDDIQGEEKTQVSGLTEAMSRALLAAFPDRLVKRREPNSRQGVIVGGRGVRLSDRSAVIEPEYYLALDVDDSGTEVLVRMASGVERSWLPAAGLDTSTVVEFDEATSRIQARQRTTWLGLLLEESPTALPDDQIVAKALISAAVEHWELAFPVDQPAVQQFLARVRCLSNWCPEYDLPRWDQTQLQALLPQLVIGCRSFTELRKAPWLSMLQSQLTSEQLTRLDREAPERITVPSGSRLPIQYSEEHPPILAVRIQEIFGWQETPRIAGGRVKLLLHLLAPNHRPQQVTDDLKSFWTSAYQIVRGELRRRYPKHAWPEDPWTATAQRRPAKPVQ